MQNSNIEIVAGRPSSGKTLLASQLCRNSVNSHESVLYISLELSSNNLKVNFGIGEGIDVIDDPNLDWGVMKNIIIKNNPKLCIIDYLQLIKGCNNELINNIVRDFATLDVDTKLVILSQISRRVGEDSRLLIPEDMHMSTITSTMTNILFTALNKTSSPISKYQG